MVDLPFRPEQRAWYERAIAEAGLQDILEVRDQPRQPAICGDYSLWFKASRSSAGSLSPF